MSKPVEHFAAPGFPAVKVTQAPNIPQGLVTISGLDEDGIISNPGGAALVRVNRGPAQVLVTTYSLPNDTTEIPDVQVARLSGPVIRPAEEGAASDIASGAHPGAQNMPEISAHIRSQGTLPEVSEIGSVSRGASNGLRASACRRKKTSHLRILNIRRCWEKVGCHPGWRAALSAVPAGWRCPFWGCVSA
ncbi:hypothetical protein [Sorlinia euscelidii]|uniref:hypothetical protein n=1 Tax=Sorlinia euscelidii TaxID=3081148 RepID=UPI003AACE4EA